MSTRGWVPSEKIRPRGLAAARNGLGPEGLVEIQRARMLAAMVQCCAERGASNVSVANVVERAGASRRTFYEIFADREECFLAAFDDAIARASRYALEAYEPDAKWSERVRSGLVGLLSFLEVEPGPGRLLIVGSLGVGAHALERRRLELARIATVIDEGRKEAKNASELSFLTAEGIVGGVLSVLHSRLLEDDWGRFLELTGPLMGTVVLPYLGRAAARRELARPVPHPRHAHNAARGDPLRDLGMRLTYRTVRVLLAVAAQPGSSNRQVADGSEISDQGQISKLLTRLHRLGLVSNTGAGSVRGAPNAWVLTDRGWEVQSALAR